MRQLDGEIEANRPECRDASVPPRRLERRQSPRFPASGSCRLSVYDGVQQCKGTGVLRNVSTEGIGIRTNLRCLPGMTIQVLTSSQILLGEVRHCTPNDVGTFDVGVLILSVLSDVS